ncbi:hypothetical protein EDD18DRAFT_1340783 [Armillaria luteobubalina]|uniref:Uncharacterized protein n=1 Tax=Armillaria luteobubalina TaxID=153913 RepID=A0AA39NV33_9AGAR|nr:hypothetical protein EDD18DRAFT_1340783 [Armillaria luteobubalina]
MADVKSYLKPRPPSLVPGHSNWLPFKRNYYCEYGPFFADYGASPSLSTALSALYNVLIPSLDVEVPDPNKSDLSAWLSLRELANVKTDLALDKRMKITLFNSPKATMRPLPHPEICVHRCSPEWYEIVFSTMDRGDVELRDVSRDTELELFIWIGTPASRFGDDIIVYPNTAIDIWRHFRREMYKLTDPVSPARLPSGHVDSPGLFNYLGRKALMAASAFASTFIADASVDDSAPLLFPSSPNHEPLATDSTSSFDIDDLAPDRPFEPLRRRKRMILSEPPNP